MFQETGNKMQLIFLLIYVPLTLGRYNVFRPRYLEPTQDYYSQEERSPGYYENDDMVDCPVPDNESDWILYIHTGFYTITWPVYSSNVLIMFRAEGSFIEGGGEHSVSAIAKIRRKFEVEPPTVCPVYEVELYAFDLGYHIRCDLMWDEYSRGYLPPYHPPNMTFIHTKCPEMGDPEEVDNPKKIFTLIPYRKANCDASLSWHNCVTYKMCPFQNTSCEAPAIAAGELGGHPRFGVQVPKTGRTYNLGGYSVFKRRAYYEYYDSPPNSYQTDDACLTSMTGILSFDLNGKRCLFSYVLENAVIMFPEYATNIYGLCNSRQNTIFTIEVRQIYEVAPPNPCPVIEAEITFRTDLTDVKCALLWGRGWFRGNEWQDFIHPVCTALHSPESIAENNPNRIFTLLPQQDTSIVHGQDFFDYKLCPGQNMSCGEMVVIATQFEWLVDVRTFPSLDYA